MSAKIKKVIKAAKAVAKKSEQKRVRKPRTEAQKARRRELAALKREAAKKAAEKLVPKAIKAKPCECAKAGAFIRAVVALVKKFGLV